MYNNVLVAHDWVGPQRHYINNQSFSINAPLDKLKTNEFSKDFWKRIGGYEIKPSLTLNDHDVFIYEIDLDMTDEGWLMKSENSLIATTSMSHDTLNRIRHRNGFIFLNLSHEPVIYEKHILDIHRGLKRDNIPLYKVILQAGNPGLKDLYDEICHRQGISDKARMHISTIEYFEYRVSELMEEFKDNESPRNLKFENIEKTFLCFNRNHREHRNNLLMLMHHANILDDCYYTMPKICPSQKTEWDVNITRECIHKHNVSPDTIDEVKHMLPLTVDTEDFSDAGKLANAWGDNVHLYNSSLISLVTETNFKDPFVFNTEKIFKPISYRHPFIMVGPARTLEYLKSLGYKTFSELWDESYDTIDIPLDRLTAIVNLCNDIRNLSVEDKKSLFYKSVAITEHNYALLKSIYSDPNKRRTYMHEFRDNWMWHGGYFYDTNN